MTTSAAPLPPPPPGRRPAGPLRRAHDLLVSPKLAIGLLVVVLLCCIVGVTVVREERAGQLIFATLWFNGLLVLLAVSSAAAFFSRAWKRKRTLVGVGMITFHLSFLGVLGGVVWNSLFAFQGKLMLTEGFPVEVGDPGAYAEHAEGRFFDPAWLRGEITLVRNHVNFKVEGENKRTAYELLVRDGPVRERAIVYATESMGFRGLRFLFGEEGYSVLLVLSDPEGVELAGRYVPLQSIRLPDKGYLYTTGSKDGPGPIPFPEDAPRVELELNFWPGLEERTGQVRLQGLAVAPDGAAPRPAEEPETRLVAVGQRARLAGYELEPREIRYWVKLPVRYDPGLNLILGSLSVGLVGMALTFAGRLRQGPGARREPKGT